MKNHRVGHIRRAERPRRTTKGRIERKAIGAMGFCDKLPCERRSLRSVNVEGNARHDRN